MNNFTETQDFFLWSLHGLFDEDEPLNLHLEINEDSGKAE